MELSQEKWIGVILLLGGRSWEDHISGPPGGSSEKLENFDLEVLIISHCIL